MQENSYSKMIWFKDNYLCPDEHLEILDIGSLDKYGHYNCRNIFNHTNWNYRGLDIKKGNNVDIVLEDIYNWGEIPSKSYDVIISSFFFKYLQFFWKTMSEIKRVIKPGGQICIIVPSDDSNHGENGVYNNFKMNDLVNLIEYFDFKIIHKSIDEKNEPWNDICIVAVKNYDNAELKIKLNNIENKLNSFLTFKNMVNNVDFEK